MPRWLSHHGSSLILLAIAASALLALAACEEEKKAATPSPAAEESPAAPVAGGPLKIGLLVDFTGALSTYGPDIENAARLAVDHINAAGGVLDQPVQLVVADSATTAEVGVVEARRLVDIEKVQVIIGSLASPVTLAVAESVTVPNEVLTISPASTSPAVSAVADDDYLFRTTISDAAQGLVLAKLIDEDLGFASVCTMFVNNPYGQGLSENFAEAFTAAGGQVSAQVPHEDTAATTYSSELNQCVAGGPEALVAISYTTGQADVYLREALEGGLINQFVFVDGTKDDEMFAKLGWQNFDGLKGTAPGALPPSEFTAKFDELFTAKYGAIYQVAFPREGYDAVMVAALAAEFAGSTDPTAIRDALRDVANAPGTLVAPPAEGIVAAFEAVRNGEDIDYSGATGSAEFDDNGDVLLGAIETWRVDAATQTLPKERGFKVDLEAGTVEEIVGGGTRHYGPTADIAAYIGPVLERARRMFS